MLRNHYIKKNGLFLKRETVMYESDYWQVEEIDAEYKTRYTWTKNQEEVSVFLIDKMLFVSLIKSENSHYQGQQHYVAVDLFGGEEGLKRTKQRDQEKLRLSKINGVDI